MMGLETEKNSDSYTCKQQTFISIIQTSSINYTQLDSVAALSYHKRASEYECGTWLYAY